MIAIRGATIYTPHQRLDEHVLLIEGGRIADLTRADEIELQTGSDVLDASGLILAPGLIDLQINGAFGLDFTDRPDAIYDVAADLPRFGVTAFLPTIVSSAWQTIAEAQQEIQRGPPANFRGAKPLGLHLEGPFLNPEKAGAHDPAFLCAPDPTRCETWFPDQGVRLVTLAPELPGAIELIEELSARGVLLGAGHSMASAAEARAAFEVGLRYGTHLFNAMRPIHHRRPGLVVALLGEPTATIGLIADGEHVHADVLDLVWRITGPQRITLVSDAMAGLGMPAGEYRLGPGRTVSVAGGGARLEDGTLAGSAKPLPEGIRNMIAATGCQLGEALQTVTANPAAVLGLETSTGTIAPGAPADLVLLTPDLDVAATFVQGEMVFQRIA